MEQRAATCCQGVAGALFKDAGKLTPMMRRLFGKSKNQDAGNGRGEKQTNAMEAESNPKDKQKKARS